MTGEAGRSDRAGAELLERAVGRFHEILLAGTTAAESMAHMHEQFARANLMSGGRPLCPYLRPHFVLEADWERITRVCEAMWSCVQKVGKAAAGSPALQAELGVTEAERALLAIDPGYDYISPTARLDSFLTASSYAFVELNAECPAGIAYADVATEIFLGQPAMKSFLDEFQVRPLHGRDHLLATLLSVWRRVRPSSPKPRIAIVDWEGLPTQAEFELFKGFFEEAGYETTIADPRHLTFEGGVLRHGEFPIDLVYKRLLTNDFLEHISELGALHEAYATGAIVLVNSFLCKYVHKKMFFGVLTNAEHAHLFTEEERRSFASTCPGRGGSRMLRPTTRANPFRSSITSGGTRSVSCSSRTTTTAATVSTLDGSSTARPGTRRLRRRSTATTSFRSVFRRLAKPFQHLTTQAASRLRSSSSTSIRCSSSEKWRAPSRGCRRRRSAT